MAEKLLVIAALAFLGGLAVGWVMQGFSDD